MDNTLLHTLQGLATEILALDPGIKNTGWAHLKLSPALIEGDKSQVSIVRSGTNVRKKAVSATTSINFNVNFFCQYLVDHPQIEQLWIEDYVLYRPSKGAGNNLKLVGALTAIPALITTHPSPPTVHVVSSSLWKRTIRKETGEQDLMKVASDLGPMSTQHEADAVCLGVFALTQLHKMED